jgi:hypothetical protein
MDKANGNITPQSITKAPNTYLEALGGSANNMTNAGGAAQDKSHLSANCTCHVP